MNRFYLGIGLIVLAASLVTGCLGVSVKATSASVCDGIPDGSYSVICQISEELGTSPETVAGVLKVANVAALSADVYDARQANEFIAGLKAFLAAAQTRGLAYAAVVEYASERYAVLPAQVQASLVLLRGIAGVQIEGLSSAVLSDYDYGMLAAHLDDQLALLAPYLTE